MRIGIDFDNTLIDYDEVFRVLARERGLIDDRFRGGKDAVRRAVRSLPDGETDGRHIGLAADGSSGKACNALALEVGQFGAGEHGHENSLVVDAVANPLPGP